MYRINTDIAWLAIGLRFAAFTDLRGLGSGLFKVTPVSCVGDGLSQVVQMAHGDRCQRSVLRLTKDLTGPLTQLLDGGSAGCVVALIHRRQQADILLGVLLGKARHGPLAALEPARLAVLGNQSGELLAGIAADLYQVADHHPFSLARAFQIAEFNQFSLNPAVAGVLVAGDRKGHRLGA